MKRRTLLLIESDGLLQLLLVDIVIDAGYDVLTRSHDDPLPRDDDDHGVPDIAIISGGPRGTFATGWRTAERLSQAYTTLPLIILSTNGRAVDEVGQTKRGRLFVAAMRKPLAVDALRATVAKWSLDPGAMEVQSEDARIRHDVQSY